MFGKVMAAVGIGSAKVDTRLEKDQVMAGEVLKGVIDIQGGEVSQTISALVLDFTSEVIKEVDGKKVKAPHRWASLRLSEPMIVESGQRQTVDFEIPMPFLSPLSIMRQQPKTWVATRADIAMAIDPRDHDALRVLPGRLHNAVFDAMKSMGFQLKESVLKPSRRNAATGCVQEFEFKPRPGSAFGHLDEAELAFLPSANGELDLLIQRDTKARGLGSFLSEMAGTDESHYLLTLRGNETADEVQRALTEVLR